MTQLVLRLSTILFLFCGALVSFGVWIGDVLPHDDWQQRALVINNNSRLVIIDDARNLSYLIKYIFSDGQFLSDHIHWSPDGGRLVFTTHDEIGTSLSTLSLFDGQIKNLIYESGRIYHPYWSPDGTRIAYVNSIDGIDTLKVINLRDDQVYSLIKFPYGIRFHWSSDGTKIALINIRMNNRSKIYVIDSEGIRLLFASENDRYNLSSDIDWSPNSEQLITSYYVSPENPELLDYTMHLNLIDLPNAIERPLLEGWTGAQFGAVWSPDGRHIAFAYDNEADDGIYLLNTQTLKTTKIIDDFAGYPSWSHDSQKITFNYMETEFTGTVYTFDLAAQKLYRIRDYRFGEYRPG